MSLSPRGFYINLDKRIDRQIHFEDTKQKYPFFSNIERMSAFEHTNGGYGCGMSHIMALKQCLTLNDEVFLICEDDLLIIKEDAFKNMIDNVRYEDNWDVLTFTPRGDIMPGQDIRDNFIRVNNNQTATAYLIKKHMVPILISNFEEALVGLSQGGDPNIYCIDQYWKQLQNVYKFYYFIDIFAGQLVGYSDIEKRNINYNDRFVKQ